MTEGRAHTSSKKDNNNGSRSTASSSLSAYNNYKLENVLILQGGGSLGAFGCGVFKSLLKYPFYTVEPGLLTFSKPKHDSIICHSEI
jgi:hypothetical protein